ncbi:Do family serine endopeptidase [Labrys wisconsinensis]|uniref:Serine protease Do n=1 Tax=Labrys wisconsinensis TaxID=425677 RepID=A0ABU0J645_9HYPH|nr:Do family serine endopeptidase [Labrys wisconsinensis]MDQ0469735.1 serine protease Do [Labrys wisconsinensis]
MTTETQSTVKPGFLARHRRTLMAGVFGLGVLGLAASDILVMQPSTPAYAQSQSQLVHAQPFSFADVVEKVRPAVVSVKVKTVTAENMSDTGPSISPDDPMFRFFKQFGFGQGGEGLTPNRPRKQFGMAQGSGFFISSDGYIVTNNHVVDHATEVDVVTDGGKTYTAKVIGTDPKTDLALLKVKDDGNFPYVDLSAQVPRVGDWVIAVGNPFGLGGTVTAGIVSARGRDIGSGPYDDFIQIDAPVNRGNSGGPTFDLNGRVIGVNTAIFSPSGGSVGIGFAIPADTVQRVVAALKADGQVTRGWIGVQIQPVTADIAESIGLKKAEGAIVADVTRDAPAAKAGLKTGDAITAVNGQPVAGPRELARAIADIKPGVDANLTVWRDGKETSIAVQTAKLPADRQMASAAQDGRDQPDDASGAVAGLGLQLAPAASVPGSGGKGVVVTDVDPSGAAADRLRAGDVIVDVGGKPVRSVADVRDGIKVAKSDGRKTVLMRVTNGDSVRFVAVPVAKG